MVYAEELSSRGIFEAIKAGHVYIIAEGPQGPQIDFTAQDGSRTAIIGGTIRGQHIEFRVEVMGGLGRTLTIWKDGIPLHGHYSVTIDQDPFVYIFSIHALDEGRVRVQVENGPYLSALTNPIYFAPEPGVWGAAHAQASTLMQGNTNDSEFANGLLMVVPAFAFLLAWRGLHRGQRYDE
jgi:hypothetical protein